MHSPLPDSSALEAGIVEDARPPCLTRVQTNVRNLLRNSVLSSIRGSPGGTSPNRLFFPPPALPNHRTQDQTPSPAIPSPLRPHHPPPVADQDHVLPSPSSDSSDSTDSTNSTSSSASPEPPQDSSGIPGILFPSNSSYALAVQQMAHHSTLFNTRAVAALHHPDLSDPSVAVFLQQKSESRQQRAWKRSRAGSESQSSQSDEGRIRRRKRRSNWLLRQWWLCLGSALVLAGLVATYLAFATTGSHQPVFHVLFILGILSATIIFVHTVIRMCLFNRGIGSTSFFLVPPPPKSRRRHGHHHGHSHRRRHHHHHGHSHSRSHRGMSNDAEREYVPPMPIPVCVPAEDEVRPDSREAHPSAGATERGIVESGDNGWDKDVEALANPPPAYGRWRGSVRANPDLLHWAPSPTTPHMPALPSPTYEEAMRGALPVGERGSVDGSTAAAGGGPPSYKTKESPLRPAGARAAHDGEESGERAGSASGALGPEMVEGRGIGFAE